MNAWSQWQAKMIEIVDTLLWSPTSSMERVILLLVTFALSSLVLNLMAKALKFGLTGGTRASGVVLIGTIVTLVSATAASLHVSVDNADLQRWLPLIAAVVALLVIVVPVCIFMLRGSYVHSVLSLVIVIGAAAIVITLAHQLFLTVRAGDERFDKTRQRRDSIDTVTDSA